MFFTRCLASQSGNLSFDPLALGDFLEAVDRAEDIGATAAVHFGLLVAISIASRRRHSGHRRAAHLPRARVVKTKDNAGTIFDADEGNTTLSSSKSHVVAARSARNAVHALAREVLRSMSDLYFSRHCFEQKPL
jgi:hypothetical protein